MANPTKEEIDKFVAGSDDEKYIIKIECEYDDEQVTIYYRDEEGNKHVRYDDFYPFCWATQEGARLLFNGDRRTLKDKLVEYGIGCKGLRVANDEDYVPDRMARGYRVMFYATKRMSYSDFMRFFKKGGVPIYPKPDDINYGKRYYMNVAPNEQYMIYTGKRQFKGYNNYDNILRYTFDLETEGLDPNVHAISQIGIRTNKGYERIIKVTGTGEERILSELSAIHEFMLELEKIDPDIATGHNIENFDWHFFDVRLSIITNMDLGTFTMSEGVRKIYKRKKQSVLKLAGEIEYFNQTIRSGTHITDSLFAVRRSQAQDPDMKKADLKYVTRYSKLNKKNRVYVPGKKINDTWADETPTYAFNDNNGDWYKITEKKPIKEGYTTVTGTYIVERYLLDDLYEADKVELKFNQTNFFLAKMLPVSYDRVYTMGTAAVWKYIMLSWSYEHGLAIPELIESHSFTGGLSRLMEVGFQGVNKHQLELEGRGDEGFENKGVVKLDYNSLYPSILLSYWLKSEVDITNGMLYLLEYILTQREIHKEKKKKYRKLADKEIRRIHGIARLKEQHLFETIEEEYEKLDKEITDLRGRLNAGDTSVENELAEKELLMSGLPEGSPERAKAEEDLQYYESEFAYEDNFQLLLKLCGNSFFGSFGSGSVFPWSDLVVAENVTCIGRMMFRLLCYHFKEKIPELAARSLGISEEEKPLYSYKPVVGDTDGVNFTLPEKYRYTEEHPYVSIGLGRNVVKGKKYTYARADVAEFEDLYMHDVEKNGINKLGLDIDDVLPVNLLLRRKHYIDLLADGKIKTVGAGIKSRSMPGYIAKFFEKAFRMLVEGRGKDFLEYYYDYVEKIYNYKIPLKDIASIGSIKTSIDTYQNVYCKSFTAAGTKKSRQAWYELAIRDNISVNMGDKIYYINTGDKKNESDVQRLTRYYKDFFGTEVDCTKEIDKEYQMIKRVFKKKPLEPTIQKYLKQDSAGKSFVMSMPDYVSTFKPEVSERDELVFNCVRIPNEIIEDEEKEYYCDERFRYNVNKYIDMFNKRVSILLVCFSPDIRYRYNEKGQRMSNILINKPSERRYFTDEECKMCSGYPNDPSDQDDYNQVMIPEDKEIRFWTSVGKKPAFADECHLNWPELVAGYEKRQETLKKEGIRDEVEAYNRIIDNLSENEVDDFVSNGDVPDLILKICNVDLPHNAFVSKKYKVTIGTIFDIIDKSFVA